MIDRAAPFFWRICCDPVEIRRFVQMTLVESFSGTCPGQQKVCGVMKDVPTQKWLVGECTENVLNAFKRGQKIVSKICSRHRGTSISCKLPFARMLLVVHRGARIRGSLGECLVKAGDVFFREGPEEMNLEVLPGVTLGACFGAKFRDNKIHVLMCWVHQDVGWLQNWLNGSMCRGRISQIQDYSTMYSVGYESLEMFV